MKLNFAPVLRIIAERYQLSPGDLHKVLNKVVPDLSRRAVAYWLTDPGEKNARRCDRHWVSLLLFSLMLDGKISAKDARLYIGFMDKVNSFANMKGPGHILLDPQSPLHMDVVNLILDSSERRQMALDKQTKPQRKSKGEFPIPIISSGDEN